MTTYDDVMINIPAGTTLVAVNGEFLFKHALTDDFLTCKRIKYTGNGGCVVCGGYRDVRNEDVQFGGQKT